MLFAFGLEFASGFELVRACGLGLLGVWWFGVSVACLLVCGGLLIVRLVGLIVGGWWLIGVVVLQSVCYLCVW